MGKEVRIFAFGGNEVSPVGLTDEKGKPIIPDIAMQWARTHETSKHIAKIVEAFPNDTYVITHGNGPQVGNVFLRSEYSRPILPPIPLDVAGADTQGAMGYMIAQILGNELRARGINKTIVGIVTQVVVDKNDPGFQNPTKYIGPSYTKEEAEERMKKDGWVMKLYKKDDKGNEIWRKVVPSPEPLDIVEFEAIVNAIEAGFIPITVGGGGIPVVEVEPDEEGNYKANYGMVFKDGKNAKIYRGVEAVIDKDLASALLGTMLIKWAKDHGEDLDVTLTIFTGEDGAKLNYQKPNQVDLRYLTLEEAKKLYAEGHFPPGSMGPKILACIKFLEGGGKKAYISLTSKYLETLEGKAGTTIVRE
ncbi:MULTISPECIES: carbamate kinase [Caldisericum]|jgi:carbamate kinase|uniref:Carbamate kinase n=1 Tax=Caldisericum exile TaxID=693075 RepID=A0A2J6WEY6_9BACT|nr:MAG: carbamate kinase [Caldisericum exile]